MEGEGGRVHFFLEGGGRVQSAQETTQFVDHKPERATIID